MMPDARRAEAPPEYDAIIVGSGAGGAAAAYRLVLSGLNVALVEKGSELPRDGSTLDFNKVVHAGQFKSHESWLDGQGKRFCPEEYFNVGGKTRWYGAALLRYGRSEFRADPDHQCPAWPIGYDDLADYYQQAEQLLGVRQFEREPDLQLITNRLARRAPRWRAEPMALGLSSNILLNLPEARHFDGFASAAGLKGDAEVGFLNRISTAGNFTVLTGTPVIDLLPAGEQRTRIGGVRLADGRTFKARTVILAAGALHSPRLLQRYVDDQNLAAQLPAARHIGRCLKMHLLTAMVAVSPGRKRDVLRKTAIFLNDDLPHSSVQPLGFDGELIGTLIPALVPRWVARPIGERAYGFFLQTEDGAHPDNCVRAAHASTQGLPQLDYDPRRTPAALQEHARLVREFRSALARAGMIAFSQRIGVAGTAHVSGTLTAGPSATESVVDARGRVYGLDGLYVVDGSILPRSSRVNPSLTIYAWSLRVADLLVRSLATETSALETLIS